MENHDNSPNNVQGEYKYKPSQKETIFFYLQDNVATTRMVALATGISPRSICRYKRDLELEGLLVEVRKDYCKVTNKLVWYLTTDVEKFPVKDQTLC